MPSDERPNLPFDSDAQGPSEFPRDKKDDDPELRTGTIADSDAHETADPLSTDRAETIPEYLKASGLPSDEGPNSPFDNSAQESSTILKDTKNDKPEVHTIASAGSDVLEIASPLNYERAETIEEPSKSSDKPQRCAPRRHRVRRLALAGNVFGLSFCLSLLGFLYFGRLPLEKLVSQENYDHLVHSSLILSFDNDTTVDDNKPDALAYQPSLPFKDLLTQIDSLEERNSSQALKTLEASRSVLFYPEYCYLQGRLAFARKQPVNALFWLTRLTETKDNFVEGHPDIFYYLGMSSLNHNKEAAREFLTVFLRKEKENDSLRREAERTLSKLSGTATGSISPEPASRIFLSENRRSMPPDTAPKVAEKLALKTKEGETVLLDELQGEILLLHFWASWCKPCIKELPSLIGFLNENPFKPYGDIVPVLVTEDTFFGEAQHFLDSRKLKTNSAMYLDPDMGTLQELTGGSFLPSTVIYDKIKKIKIKIIPKASDWNSKEMQDEILKTIEVYLKTRTSSGEMR